jgi:long-chain acyl-CoA synthetase
MTSVADLIPMAAQRRPDKPALIHGEAVITYGELEDRVARCAGALGALDVEPGDRVALLVGNVPDFVVALHGALHHGAVAAPLNVMLTPEELGFILADAQASAVVADPALAPAVLAVRDRLPSLRHILVTGPGPGPVHPGALSFQESVAAAGPTSIADAGPDDLAVLAYTAGTTAEPKGAMLSHGNLLANLDQISEVPALRQAESDVVLLVVPLFHIYGLNAGLGVTLKEGASAVLMERFDPVASLEAVERHGVTVLPGAPPMFPAWLDAATGRDVDLSTVRLAVSGAAPLPGAVLKAFRDRLGITIWEGYGLTETSPVVTTNAVGDEAKPDSIGLPLPGVEVRLVDEAGDDVEDGDPGEIVIRGPNVFTGYWNRPRETEAAFQAGWLRTGDVAFRDEDGYLSIVDRSKDLVIVSGFNVYPKEVEEAVAGHPAVAECAVVGVPDERTGEAIRALVVLKGGASATEEDILEHCRDRLARFKLPREIEIVASLPHHVTGKVLRRRLREPAP